MISSERVYRSRIRAWTMYDWANSAFATTILAAVLPVYYGQVAASTLPSSTVATAYWSAGLSISIFIGAFIAPVLGTVSDIMRGKKLFLAAFAGLGVVCTGLLVLVKTGDWLLASLLFVFGRLGFACANIFYDSLLPHVAHPEDQDSVSTRGYAMGYLGGGLLLAVNVVMIRMLPGTWGARLSFVSVALWWALFSIPVLVAVPEPHTLTARLAQGETVLRESFRRIWQTLKDMRQYKELFKFLLTFLIYVDGIGTIIGIAAIYGAELGFGSLELILALLLVQFVGIPFSLIFGSLPNPQTVSPEAGHGAEARESRFRPVFLAFIVFNLVLLPLTGILGTRFLPRNWSGATPPPYRSSARFAGEGQYPADAQALSFIGSWQTERVAAQTLRAKADRLYRFSVQAGSRIDFPFNGHKIILTYAAGPDRGIWNLEMDGQPLAGPEGRPMILNSYSPAVRYELTATLLAENPGEHVLTLINNGEKDTRSSGIRLSIGAIQVLPAQRKSNLAVIIGLIFALESICFALALLLGRLFFAALSLRMTTKSSLILALIAYTVITVWGFFLSSVLEFWCLAWLVACVQGGSQALSRSLFSSMIPAVKSGEFFGLFGIMEKFATIIGPLVFAGAAAAFGSSRPAVLSLILFFIVGTVLLLRVNVEEGRRVARAEDERLRGSLE